jgi:hypothetical protein
MGQFLKRYSRIIEIILPIGLGWGLSMILPSTLHNGISIIFLTVVVIAILIIGDVILRRRKNWSVFRQRKGAKMIFGLGILFVVGGLVMIVTQLDFRASTPSPQTTTPPTTTPLVTSPTSTFKFPTFVDASEINPSQEVDIWLGENGICSTYKWSDFTSNTTTPMTIASLGGTIPFRPHVFGAKLYLDVSVYGGKDFTPIAITNNVATVLPPNWDKNHDDYAYEVINANGDPIFQLIYKTQFSIVVNGVFPFPGGVVVADNSGFRLNAPFETLHLKPIFKYPSKGNEGVRVNYEQ